MAQAIAGAAHAIGKIEGFSDFTLSNSGRNNSTNITGTTLLFYNWTHSGVIYSNDNKYLLDGINFDIKNGEFVIQDQEEEQYTFTTSKIDKVVIDDTVYKTVFNSNSGNYELFQVMHDDDGIEILKGFELVVIEASPNPMVNRKLNKVKKREIFYSRYEDQLSKIKMSKRKLLMLLKDDDHLLLKTQLVNSKNRRTVYKN